MNSKYWFLVFIIFFGTYDVISQEFSTQFTFANQSGTINDTLLFGFDATATSDYDDNFQTGDLNKVSPEENLGIRLAQLNSNLFLCDDVTVLDDNSLPIKFQSKTDFIPFECERSEFPSALSFLLIPNKSLPVTMSWDSSDFKETCVESSFMTYLSPNAWWDYSCGLEECFDEINLEVSLSKRDNLKIDCPVGIQFVNEFGDTISMMTIAFNAGITSSVSPEPIIEDGWYYPNPSNGLIQIKSESWKDNHSFSLFTPTGELVLKSKERALNISKIENGIYFIILYNGSGRLVSSGKIIKVGE